MMNKPRKKQLAKAERITKKRIELKIAECYYEMISNGEAGDLCKCNVPILLKGLLDIFKTETITERLLYFQYVDTGIYRFKIGQDISEVYFIDLENNWHKVEKEIINLFEGEY